MYSHHKVCVSLRIQTCYHYSKLPGEWGAKVSVTTLIVPEVGIEKVEMTLTMSSPRMKIVETVSRRMWRYI